VGGVIDLEDDWEFVGKVNFEEIKKMLDNSPNKVAVLFSRKDKRSSNKTLLSPGVWRGDVARKIVEQMIDDINPETQIKKITGRNSTIWWPVNYSIVRDIGRDWKKKYNLPRQMRMKINYQ